jgi:hypothetical protein
MAFHRGRIDLLERHLRRDFTLLSRRFPKAEIYPPDICAAGPEPMCGTPIDGGTLLHLAVDFDEREVFDWLRASGADVNAAATIDGSGFGGHTPLEWGQTFPEQDWVNSELLAQLSAPHP